VTYDELPDERQLFYQGVGPPSTKLKKLEDARLKDDRLPPELAFCALGENDSYLGRLVLPSAKRRQLKAS